MATSGGCVSGRKEIVELCRQKARPYAHLTRCRPRSPMRDQVLDIIGSTTERRDKLRAEHDLLAQGAHGRRLRDQEGEARIVPVMLYNAEARPGTSRGTCTTRASTSSVSSSRSSRPDEARIRTQLSADHEMAQLQRAAEAFGRSAREYGILGLDKKGSWTSTVSDRRVDRGRYAGLDRRRRSRRMRKLRRHGPTRRSGARRARPSVLEFDQERTDRIIRAVFEATYAARLDLARLAHEETAMGLYEHKAIKNVRGPASSSTRTSATAARSKRDRRGSRKRSRGRLRFRGPILATIPVTEPTVGRRSSSR